jgi:hypothetical protein
MKVSDLLVYINSIVGAIAGFFLLAPPLSWVAVSICAVFAAWTLFATQADGGPVLRLAGLSWSMEDFVRGWLITGRTGSGKTQCAINAITFQVFQNVPYWGGVCLDQKGLYWEILVKMAAHFGREKDLTLLQTRPLGKDELWRPVHTINITGNPNVPASTYAKVIVDTAASLTGGRGQNPFFPTKAQIAIQTGFEVLRHMEAYVTIPNIHRLLLNEADANAAIETLMNKGDQRSHELVVAFRDGFFGQPPEQLGGVQGTLSTYRVFHQPGNRRGFLRERADFFDGSDRRWKNRVHRHAAEIPIRATLPQYHPKVVLLLPRLEPIRQTSRRTGEGQSHHPVCR